MECRDATALPDRVYTACGPCRRRKRKCDGKGPICSPCLLRGETCKWALRKKPSSNKRHDKSYVRSLELQVKHLSSLLQGPSNSISQHNDTLATAASTSPVVCHSASGISDRALRDFSFLNWRCSVPFGEGELLFSGPGRFTTPSLSSLARFSDPIERPHLASDEALDLVEQFSHNINLKNRMIDFFLQAVNVHYQFVEISWLAFHSDFPRVDPDFKLLYSAVFAVSAHCLHVSADIENALMVYTESLVMPSFGAKACLPVMKAISILAWFKQTLLSRSDGFAYQYMALGLSPNLKLDDLPSGSSATGNEFDRNHIDRIKAFWSLFLIERTSTPGLGLPQAIPWDYNHAPLSACLSLSVDDCPTLYFRHHCRLLQLHHLFIETCYMPGFSSLEVADQKAQLRRASEALLAFRQPTNECAHVNTSSRCGMLRTILWISYHAAIINLYRPFIDCSWAWEVDSTATPLKALTIASDSIAKLLEHLGTGTEVQNMPPFVIYHILRAALVQCLNMTVLDEQMKSTAREKLHVCLVALSRMKETWKVPGEACINFLIYVGQSWKITPW